MKCLLGSQVFVLVNDGVSEEEVKTRAAEAAVRILKERQVSDGGVVLQLEETIALHSEMVRLSLTRP
jgi:hypothetical protein